MGITRLTADKGQKQSFVINVRLAVLRAIGRWFKSGQLQTLVKIWENSLNQ